MLRIDPGYMDAQGQDQLRAVIRRLSYSPQAVHAEVHAETPVRDAVPMVVVCSRCEQNGHKKAECTGACAACGHAWPDCASDCTVRFDQSEELLMMSESMMPPVSTSDLDSRPYTALPGPTGVVGASTGSTASVFDAPDAEVIARYSDTLHERFVPLFPSIDGLTPSRWMALVTSGQFARLCRAVGTVIQATQRHAVPGQGNGMIRWDPSSQAEIRGAQHWLRDEVMAVSDDIREIVATMWDI
jgi:hypothetical protein